MAGWRKKTWKDRKTEYPTRRTLTKTDGSTEIVTVTRNEGQVSQEGDAFSAENLNDLEARIDDGFTEVNGKLMRMRNLAFTTDNMGEYIIGQKIIPIFMTTNNSEYYPKFEFYNYNNDIKVRVTNFSSAEYKIIPEVYFNCNLYYFDI